MGRKFPGSLSPFLCIGVSFASFSLFGKSPDWKHLLMISVSGGERLVAHALTSLGETLSWPEDFLEDSVLMIFQVWVLFISLSWNKLVLFSFGGRNSWKFAFGFLPFSFLMAAV